MKNGNPVLHSTDPKASENQVVFTQLATNIQSRPTTAIPGIVQKYCYLFAKSDIGQNILYDEIQHLKE